MNHLSADIFDENYIQEIRSKFKELENVKDKIHEYSLKVNRLSKEIIYSIIRNDLGRASELKDEISKYIKELKDISQKYELRNMISTSLQEYCEAIIFYEYLKSNRIPTHHELEVDEHSYIAGLAEFCGELLRKAVEEMIRNNLEFARNAKEIIEKIYLFMLKLELKSYELRKKLDYVSNILNRLTEYIFLKSK